MAFPISPSVRPSRVYDKICANTVVNPPAVSVCVALTVMLANCCLVVGGEGLLTAGSGTFMMVLSESLFDVCEPDAIAEPDMVSSLSVALYNYIDLRLTDH